MRLVTIYSMDFQKLNTASNMFKAFARLAESIKGNFDGLAECINEDIMPTIEETKELMKRLPAALDDAGNRISKAVKRAAEEAGESIVSAANNVINQPEEKEVDEVTPIIDNTKRTDNEGENKLNQQWLDKQAALKNMNERWQGNSIQDILDVMMGATGGIHIQKGSGYK